MKIKAVNKFTGEVYDFDVKTLAEATELWREMGETEKMCMDVKNQIKLLLPSYVGVMGISERVNGYAFRHIVVQRQDYDKALMRKYFDEDTFDLLTKPDKKAVDEYIKANLMDLPPEASELRKNMVDVGKPYEVWKLEKVGQ